MPQCCYLAKGPKRLFRGSSQDTTGKLKKEFEQQGLKELKDRVQTIAIGILTQGKRSIFENIY